MSNIWGPTNPVNQNQQNLAGPLDALQQEKFTGEVEHAYLATTVFEPHFKRKMVVKGTNVLTKKAIGRTKLQKLGRGQAPDGTQVPFSKAQVTVDTMLLSRHTFDELETIQTDIDARSEVAAQAGRDIADFYDITIAIGALKAAAATTSPYSNGAGLPEGFSGATQVTIPVADVTDPAVLYHKIGQMLLGMEQKNVDPRREKVLLVVRPREFYTLQDAEQIVNGEYITSNGNKLDNIPIFKAWGVPVISTNNLPNSVVSGHLLSNADNGNFYDGDFSTVVALAVSPKALMIGESKPLQTKIWYSDESKTWVVDAWFSFGIGLDRVEHAARLDTVP